MKSRVARLAVFLFILMLQAKDGNPAVFDRNQPDLPDWTGDIVRNLRHRESIPSTVPDSEPVQFVPSKVKDTTQMNERDSMDGEREDGTSETDQWPCDSCTLLNDLGKTKCAICDAPAPKKSKDWNKDIEKSSTHKTRDFDAFNTALFPNDSADTKTRDEDTIVSFTPLNLAVGDKASPPGQADRNNDENAGTLTALNRKKIGFNNRTRVKIQVQKKKRSQNSGVLNRTRVNIQLHKKKRSQNPGARRHQARAEDRARHSWKCRTCTFDNYNTKANCEMCGAKNMQSRSNRG
eukprot:271918_1